MAHYRALGRLPRQRHTQLRDDDGHLFREELMGEEGFSSDSSLLYHRGVPSAITDSQVWELPDQSRTPNHPLKPRHLKLHDLETGHAARSRAAGWSSATTTSASPTSSPAPSPRRSTATPSATSASTSSPAPARSRPSSASCAYRAGDYVIVPRATDHRWVPAEPSRLYAIEANSHIHPPKRYLSRFGQLLEHAPYCERDLHGPDRRRCRRMPTTAPTSRCWSSTAPVRGIVGTRLTYATHPFDVVGWDGCLYPYTFNIEDYMPITGKVHQPPPVHQVFEGWNFVICNFLPRKVDYHDLAIPVPYYHSNVDSDEVMFYVGGDYEARKGSGIDIGSISLHPGGHAHGPQPSAIEASLGVDYFDESAVMVDTFAPLELGEGGLRRRGPGVRLDLGRPRTRRRRRRRRARGLQQQLRPPPATAPSGDR